MVLALGQVVNSAGISLKIGVLRSYSQTHSSSLFGLHLVPTCLYSTCFMKSQWNGNRLLWKRFKQFCVWEFPTSWSVLSGYIEQLSMSVRGSKSENMDCTAILNLLQWDLFRILLALKQKMVHLRSCCFNRIWFANLIHWISI